MATKRPFKLRQASSYFRLAAKAQRAGEYRQAEHYTDTAQRILREYHREKEARDRLRNHRPI